MTTNMSGKFLAADSADFYFAATGKLAGIIYLHNQAFVGSSLDSRRTNALLPSSWSPAISFPVDDDDISHLAIDSITQTETVTIGLEFVNNVSFFENFVHGGYDSLDVDTDKIVKINMPPALEV